MQTDRQTDRQTGEPAMHADLSFVAVQMLCGCANSAAGAL